MTNKKKTMVIGASDKAYRYSYRAVSMLDEHGYEVIPLGRRNGKIGPHQIAVEKPGDKDVHTVTLYLNRDHQQAYYNYILSELKPERIIFNPGAENDELRRKAEAQGIETLNACTLVMLQTGQY